MRTYRAEWNRALNRHGTGHRMATDRWARSTVVMRLHPRGKAEVTDRGERGHSSMDRFSDSRRRTRWGNRWRGRWVRKGGALTLRLRLVKRTCQRSRTVRLQSSPRGRTTRQPCPSSRKRLTLTCSQTTIRELFTKRRHKAWSCLVRGSAPGTNGSSSPWVFGLRQCLRVVGGWRLEYQACGAQPAGGTP